MLECVAYPFSRGSSWPKNWTRVSYITGRFFTNWATREAPSGCLAKIKGTLLGVEWSGSWSHSKARSLGPRTIQVSFSQSWEALLNLWGIQERLWRSQVVCCLAAGWGTGTLRGTEVILLHLPVLVMGDAFRPGFTDSSGNHRNQNNRWSGSTQSPEVRCIVITIGEVGKRARRVRLAENSGDIYFNMASQGESKQADSKGDTHLCKKKHQKWWLGVWRKSPIWGQILLWGPSFGDQNPVT